MPRKGICDICFDGFFCGEDLIISLTLSEPESRGKKRCRIKVEGKSLTISDLDTEDQLTIGLFRRVHLGAAIDINQTIDLASLIPGFAAASASERQYRISFQTLREFHGPLPESISIQLPDFFVGDRLIKSPPLELKLGIHSRGHP